MFRLKPQENQYSDRAYKNAYDKVTNIFSNLFDMLDNSNIADDRATTVSDMRDVLFNMTSLLPDDESISLKTHCDLNDVAEWLAYSERWYGEGRVLTNAQALADAREFKRDLEDKDPVFTYWTDQLIQKAPNDNERDQTIKSCQELEEKFAEFRKVVLGRFFNEPALQQEQERVATPRPGR